MGKKELWIMNFELWIGRYKLWVMSLQFKVGSRSPPLITAYRSNQSVKSVLIREIRVSYKSAKSAFPPFGNSRSTMHHPGLAIYSKSKKSSDFKNSFAHMLKCSFFRSLNLYFFYFRMLVIVTFSLSTLWKWLSTFLRKPKLQSSGRSLFFKTYFKGNHKTKTWSSVLL